MSLFSPTFSRTYRYNTEGAAVQAVTDAAIITGIDPRLITVESFVYTNKLTRDRHSRIGVMLDDGVPPATRRYFWDTLNTDARLYR